MQISTPEGPSAKQLMSIANQKLETLLKKPANCSTATTSHKGANEAPPTEAFFCTISDEKPRETLELRHENDLNPFEAIMAKTGNGNIWSDDVGRTAGFFGRYDKETSLTHKYVQLRSDGFGKQVTRNGQSQDSSGKYYLQFLEINQLILGQQEKISQTKNTSTSRDIEAELEVRTDKSKGYIAQPIQEAWHKGTEPSLQYHYVDGDEGESIRMSVKAGMTKIIKADLGDFKCSGTGTALVGIDSNGRAVVENRIKTEVEKGDINGSNLLNPWWAISLWRNDRYANQDFRSETGVKFSTGWKTSSGLIVKPYYGMVRYRSVDDRVYSLGSRGGEEPMHMIGLIIQFK